MGKWITLALTALLLAGCAGNRVDYNRSSLDLAIGMSKADVQAVMGAPRRTDVNESRERWIFWSPVVVGLTPIDNESMAKDRLVVTFEDGNVSRWGNQTLADDIIEASRKSMESSYQIMREAQTPAP